MSEYQYYEFQAIDRRLAKGEMDELRKLSTRADITPTGFTNVYNYGDFRGDPLELMERYFDAFVYVANWGTRRFMLRLPRTVLDPKTASRYSVAETVGVHARGEHVILEFTSDNEEGGGWEEGEGWLVSLIPVRDEIARGDLRALYLGWLLGVSYETVEDEAIEPPVPPGLGRLSPALQTFVEFLRIDQDLVAVAGERSPDVREEEPSPGDLERWVRELPESEKDALLLRLLERDERQLRAELLRRFRQTNGAGAWGLDAEAGGRTARELVSAAEERAEEREHEEAERAERERARRQQEEAAARAAYLDDLATRQEEAWSRALVLIESKRAAEYDQAVRLVTDLRDVSLLRRTFPAFQERLNQLRARHATKRSLIDRLDRAGLRSG